MVRPLQPRLPPGDGEAVRRALVWALASAPAALRERHRDLLDAVLPDEHRDAWRRLAAGGIGATEEENDAYAALEAWVTGD